MIAASIFRLVDIQRVRPMSTNTDGAPQDERAFAVETNANDESPRRRARVEQERRHLERGRAQCVSRAFAHALTDPLLAAFGERPVPSWPLSTAALMVIAGRERRPVERDFVRRPSGAVHRRPEQRGPRTPRSSATARVREGAKIEHRCRSGAGAPAARIFHTRGSALLQAHDRQREAIGRVDQPGSPAFRSRHTVLQKLEHPHTTPGRTHRTPGPRSSMPGAAPQLTNSSSETLVVNDVQQDDDETTPTTTRPCRVHVSTCKSANDETRGPRAHGRARPAELALVTSLNSSWRRATPRESRRHTAPPPASVRPGRGRRRR